MRHLTLEALARLVDEAPVADEREHLAGCERCRAELDALRSQTEALATLPKLVPAPDRWSELEGQLREEGLIRGGRRRPWSPAFSRIAAGLALFLVGGAAGYSMRGPAMTTADPVAAVADAGERAAPVAGPVATMAPAPAAASPQANAAEEVERTEQLFAAALDRYMRANATEAPDPAARLAALDNIVLTTAEALAESPADPVINGYHLTAVAQRNELLRQLAASSGEPVF